MRILIIKLSSMGDVLHALPVLSDIKKHLGDDTQIDWVCEPAYAHLLQDHSFIHKAHSLPLREYKSFLKGISSIEAKKLKQFLKNNSYDVILDLQGLLKSAWVSRWAHGKRLGYDAKSIREPLASWFYHQTISVSKNQHAISRMRELAAKAFGYAVPSDEPHYFLGSHHKKKSTHVKTTPKLILFPFTTWESKHWPNEHWENFIKLSHNYFNIVIAWGSEKEHQQAQSFCKLTTNCELAPELTIERMKEFLNDCDAFVGVDTGFSHLATAMDLPGIILMGPTDKTKSGPLGSKQIALDIDLPCRPCHKRQCPLTIEPNTLRPKCLALLSPELVLKKLQQIINSTKAR
jgi:heptosyltransferase-1